jgi:hypothetical protein
MARLALGLLLALLTACGSSDGSNGGAAPGGNPDSGPVTPPGDGGTPDAAGEKTPQPDVPVGTCGPDAALLLSAEDKGSFYDLGDLVVDDTYVYYTRIGGVFRAPKIGGPPQRMTEGINGNASRIAQDATHVYWADAFNTIRRTAKAGGPVEDVVAAPIVLPPDDQEIVRGLTIESGTLIYGGELVVARKGFVRTVAVTGGTVTTLYDGTQAIPVAGCSPAYVSDVATRGSDVLFAHSCGSIVKVPMAGGASSLLASGSNGLSGLAVGDAVYFVTQATVQALSNAGAVTVVATGTAVAEGLVRDGATLYVTSTTGLAKVAAAGGAWTTLSSLNARRGVVTDATRVYWIVSDAAKNVRGICYRTK